MGKRGKTGGIGPAVWMWRWWLVAAPVDFRCGADRLLVHAREVLGCDPLEGGAFVSRNRRSNRIKVLVAGAYLALTAEPASRIGSELAVLKSF